MSLTSTSVQLAAVNVHMASQTRKVHFKKCFETRHLGTDFDSLSCAFLNRLNKKWRHLSKNSESTLRQLGRCVLTRIGNPSFYYEIFAGGFHAVVGTIKFIINSSYRIHENNAFL